jgi:hypothetical protein
MSRIESDTSVAPPVPDLGAMNNGVDVLALDLANPAQAERQAIFAYVADTPTTDQKYSIPSQMTFVELDATALNALTAVIQSAYDMQKTISASMSVSGELEEFTFSGSGSYTSAETTTDNFKTVLSESSSVVQLWKLIVKEGTDPPLSDDFTSAVANLPEAYDPSTYTQYTQFIKTYGTHYFSECTFGGRTYQHFTADTKIVTSLVTQGISVSEEAGIALLANFGETAGTSTSNYTAFMTSVSPEQVQWVGGTASQHWDTWVASVRDDPVVVASSLVPIYELPNLPAAIQSNMQTAFGDHMRSGADSTSGRLCYRAWTSAREGVVVSFSPMRDPSIQLAATDEWENGVWAVKINPPTQSGPGPFELINPANSADTSPYAIGGEAVFVAPEAEDPITPTYVQQDGNQINLTHVEPYQPVGIWHIVNPLNPDSSGDPLFPGATVQLKNSSTGEFLGANQSGNQPAVNSDELDPLTYWFVTPA